jgi:ATP-dependent helicase/nuclease subunit A
LPLQGLGAQLSRWQQWLAQLPPHDALQAIYADGDLLARYAAAAPEAQRPAVLANLRALLMAALHHEGGRFLTPYTLVRALKAGGIAAPATVSDEAVRLLTIHGAKGLEAELVLLLDTHTPTRASESMGVLVDWPGESAHPRRFAFVLSESRPPACLRDALDAESRARHREELNTLYVAMTRARQVLAISAITPAKPPRRSWWERLQGQAQEIELPAPGALAARAASPVVHLAVLPELPAALRAERPGQMPDSQVARIGQAMHRLLEWGQTGAAQVRAVAREFRLDEAMAEEARARALRILQGEGAWAWGQHLLWQGSEVELAHQGQLLRLDRLVHHPQTGWWVLDHKSAGQPEAQADLVAQLQAYRQAVQALQGEPVRAAFLTAEGRLVEIGEGTA